LSGGHSSDRELRDEKPIANKRALMRATDPRKAAGGAIGADVADIMDADAVHDYAVPDTDAQEIAFVCRGMSVYSR